MDPAPHVLTVAELTDQPVDWPVLASEELAGGAVTTYVQDSVLGPDEHTMQRQYLRHPGAVGVIALDDQERVVLVRQYRHPVRHKLVEPPAGLLDVDGEDYLVGAQRELAEEVGLAASQWHVLVDFFTSPGMVTESLRIYLARDLSPVPAPEGFVRHGEEADMDTVWAPLSDVVDALLAGRLHNPVLTAGALAAWAARQRGYAGLRPADAPWPARDASLHPSASGA
ncbi:MAG: NUDIX domain-containing protein [Propionibacteriaceae bacterium]